MFEKTFSSSANNGNTKGATVTATESLSGESVLTSEVDKLLFLDFVFDTLLKSSSYSASDYSNWSKLCGIVYGFMPDNEEALKKLDSFCQKYDGYVSIDDVKTKWKNANYAMADTPDKAEKQLWKLLEEHKSDSLLISVNRAFDAFKQSSKHNHQPVNTANKSYFNFDSATVSPIDQAKAQLAAMFDKSNLHSSFIGFAKTKESSRKFYPVNKFPFDTLALNQPSQTIINPLKKAKYYKAKTDQASVYLYTLLESDNLTLDQQKDILAKENIPAAAIYFTGSKSIHAVVKINAASYKEYIERVNDLHDYLNKKYAALSNKPIFDSQCKHYAHLCRISGCINEKTGNQVQLLAINTGYSDYNEWKEKRESLYNELFFSPSSKISLDLNYDPDAAFKEGRVLMGNKLLMSGGSMILNACAGEGKSSLALHLGLCLATGTSFFGIPVIQPSKTLLLTAENDFDELNQNYKSIYDHTFQANYTLEDIEKVFTLRNADSLFDHLSQISTDFQTLFFKALENEIKKNKYKVVILDPLFKFFKGNIKEQEAATDFTRNKLHPLSKKYDCAIILTHHKNKPKDLDLEAYFQMQTYSGSGSSELTNWARCVMNLDPFSKKIKTNKSILTLGKRGERAGNGDKTCIYLQKAPNPNNLYWMDIEAPNLPEFCYFHSKYEEFYYCPKVNADEFKKLVCRKYGCSEMQYWKIYRNAIVPRYVAYDPETKTYIGLRLTNSLWYQSSSNSKLTKEEEDQNKTVEQLIYEIKSEQQQQSTQQSA